MTTDHEVEGSNPSERATKNINSKVMRKIFILILITVLVFIGNFSLWFLHTRSINQALLQFKRELLHNNIRLNYEDIKFTNFKSWRVGGQIEKISVNYGRDYANTFKIASIDFKSYPFKKRVILSSNEVANLAVSRPNSGIEESFDFVPLEGSAPEAIIKLEIALKDVIGALKDIDAPKLHLIDSLVYSDGGFTMVDRLTNTNFGQSKSSHLRINTLSNKFERRFEFDYNLTDLVFDQQYQSRSPSNNFINDFYKKLGNVNLDIQFAYRQTPSKLLLELMNKDKENKKNYKRIFDSYQIEIRKISQTSDVYNMMVDGSLDRQPNTFIPDMNINVKISNYKPFVYYFSDLYNASVKQILSHDQSFPTKLMTPQSTQKLITLFEELKPIEDSLNINVKHQGGGEITVSGKPLLHFLKPLQDIFFTEQQD